MGSLSRLRERGMGAEFLGEVALREQILVALARLGVHLGVPGSERLAVENLAGELVGADPTTTEALAGAAEPVRPVGGTGRRGRDNGELGAGLLRAATVPGVGLL